MNFSKKLTKSEAKWKLLRLPGDILKQEFPQKNEIFDVEFMNKIYKLKVNTSNQIIITQLYENHKFQENEILKIEAINSGFKFYL